MSEYKTETKSTRVSEFVASSIQYVREAAQRVLESHSELMGEVALVIATSIIAAPVSTVIQHFIPSHREVGFLKQTVENLPWAAIGAIAVILYRHTRENFDNN